MANQLIKKLIEEWREEYRGIKDDLMAKGGESNSYEYSILATEALRLAECINDAAGLLLELGERDT